MRAFLFAALAVVGLATPCAAVDQILGAARVDSSTSTLRLPGGPKLGTYQGGVFVSTPDSALVSNAQVMGSLGGLQPMVGMGANLTGNPFSSSITPPSSPIGNAAYPLAGIYSNVVSNNGHASTRNGNIAAYRAAYIGQVTAYANSPDVFGGDIQVNHDQSAPTDISVIGWEIDMAKNGSRDCASLGGPVYCAGFLMTSSTDGASSWGPAFSVEGVANSFHYGYVLNGPGVKDVGFFDNSTATTSYNIAGSHATGLNFSGTITGQQIAGIGWSVDKIGNLAAASGTFTAMVATGRTQITTGAPNGSSASCTAGEIKINSDKYLYACWATNSWVRYAPQTF